MDIYLRCSIGEFTSAAFPTLVLDTEHTLLAELALIGVRLFGGVVR